MFARSLLKKRSTGAKVSPGRFWFAKFADVEKSMMHFLSDKTGFENRISTTLKQQILTFKLKTLSIQLITCSNRPKFQSLS